MKQVRVRKRAPRVGFQDAEDVSQIAGSKEHMPADAVESVIERYTGRAIPLDVLYPEPPGPAPKDPHISYDGPAPRRDVIPISDPSVGRRDVLTNRAYQQEARLRMLHRLLMRGASMQQISTSLDVSMSEAYMLRSELFKRISAEARNIDLPTFVGMSMGFYSEVKASALRGYDSGTTESPITHKEKQGYLAIAKAAEDSQNRLLQAAGFFDSVKLHPKAQEAVGEVDDIGDMQRALKMLMDPTAFHAEITATLKGGDAQFSFDDDDDDDVDIRVI